MTFLSDAQPQFEKAIEHLQKELSSIRTGRATPALVEDVSVEAYGATQPIKSLASISTPDAKTVQIEPWDGSVTKSIESALLQSDIGINPTVDGKTIRLVMPMMTDEDRQRLVKVVKEKLEEARIAVRQIREDVKKQVVKSDMTDDEKRDAEKDLDENVKSQNERISELGSKKEEEITKI